MEDTLSLEELDALFNSDTEPAPPNTPPVDTALETTKAFSKRLKESTEKAINTERENIAKQLGYASFEEMTKKQEAKLFEDKGLDANEIAPIVDELVKKKLEDDPRIKELENYKKKQVEEFGKRELAEITKLTDGEISSLDKLSPEVISLWKQTGSLKTSFLQLEGEKYLLKAKATASKGSTNHLQTPSGAPPAPSITRPLTDQEKKYWKFFVPSMTQDELDKKTVKIEEDIK